MKKFAEVMKYDECVSAFFAVKWLIIPAIISTVMITEAVSQ